MSEEKEIEERHLLYISRTSIDPIVANASSRMTILTLNERKKKQKKKEEEAKNKCNTAQK